MTVACVDAAHVRAVRELEGVRVDRVSDLTFLTHKGGKIELNPKLAIKLRDRCSGEYPGTVRTAPRIARFYGRSAVVHSVLARSLSI